MGGGKKGGKKGKKKKRAVLFKTGSEPKKGHSRGQEVSYDGKKRVGDGLKKLFTVRM